MSTYRPRMLKPAVLALSVVLLTGCGSSKPTSPPTSTLPSTAAAAKGLLVICPEVEAALPKDVAPSDAEWQTFSGKLAVIRGQSNVEAQNAIDLLADGVYTRLSATDPIDGVRAVIDGIRALALRCKAAGSTALQ